MYNKKFLKIIILIVSFILSTIIFLSVYFIINKINEIKVKKHIKDSFIGTNTDKTNYIFDDELKLFVLKPNTEVTSARKIDGQIVYSVKYKSDENSFRYTPGNKNNNTFIFLGCSFMFGEGINDNETLPYFFSEKVNFNYNVINAGVPGTATNTAYIALNSNKFINTVNTKIDYIIYGFFFDHIYRNIVGAHQEGAFKLKNNKLTVVDNGVSDDVFSNKILRKYYKNEAINLTIKLIQEMKILAEEKYKAQFLVFLYDPYESITMEIKKILDELGIQNICSTINYSDKPDGYYMIKNECHPTGNANKENALTIYNYIFNIKNN